MERDGVVVRPMAEADVVAAQAMAYETMRRAGAAYAMPVPEATEESRSRGQAQRLPSGFPPGDRPPVRGGDILRRQPRPPARAGPRRTR